MMANIAKDAVDPAHPQRRQANRRYAKYGITQEEYSALSEQQGRRCAICGNSPEGRGKDGILVVDHSHETDEVRGLLCGNCNLGLGCFGDDPATITAAGRYLERWATATTQPCPSMS